MTSLSTHAVSHTSRTRNFLRKIAGPVAHGVNNLQKAQMNSVLKNMTNGKLNEIDVKRSEIAQHAEQLVK